MGMLLVSIGKFLLCFIYETKYKKADRDTSFSPDGKYELILQEVGEPDWPFGDGRGQVVLKQDKKTISQTAFELSNDGKRINSYCWKVTWNDDYVEIILSGEEQSDEQILMLFNGTVKTRQLTETKG